MRQVLFEIPGLGIKIFGYGLMLFFAFLGSMNIAARRAQREKIDPEIVYDMALYVFIGGLVGARAFYVFEYWGVKIHSFWEIFEIWKGGIVFYGSVFGGTFMFFLYRYLRPFPLRPMLDVIALGIAFGIAIGRVGCFLNGCCYGDVCNLPWAVQFPKNSPAWDSEVSLNLIPPSADHSLWLHPTQLYSTIDGLIILLLLLAYFPLRKRDGEVMGLLMLVYPISRFLVEHLRNDEGTVAWTGMTISQLISIAIFAGGLVYWFVLSRLPLGRYADTVKPETTPELAKASVS